MRSPTSSSTGASSTRSSTAKTSSRSRRLLRRHRDSAAPPCTTDPQEVAGNAFYCSTEDVVAWDAQQLLPELQDKFGDFVIPVVMAHEWGHAVQARSISPRARSPASCRPTASRARGRDMRRTTASSTSTPRISTPRSPAFSICATALARQHRPECPWQWLRPGQRVPGRLRQRLDGARTTATTSRWCSSCRSAEADAARGGDAPYDSIVNGVPYDIEDYLTQVYPELSNGQSGRR